MTSSYSVNETFSKTHAKHLASRVASDLYQCSRLYGSPTEGHVTELQEELIVMLAGGYVSTYEFGFKEANGSRVETWFYQVDQTGNLVTADDRSGGIRHGADVSGAQYFNFMSYSAKWWALSDEQRRQVKSQHPVDRGSGDAPVDGAGGTWHIERTYSSGGVRIERRNYRKT